MRLRSLVASFTPGTLAASFAPGLIAGTLAVFATGCASDLATGTTAGELGSEFAISVIDGGTWGRRVSCPSPSPATCMSERNFWIDIAVRNDAYDKRVGILWIDTVRDPIDGPWRTAYASYEYPLDAPHEQWGIDVTAGTYSGIEPLPRIRFAAFVEMNGATYWDNNGGADHELAGEQ